jgi:hypothetical protein
MYGLSLGVQRINEVLPPPVYALLSGLNASTVGIIALAAVQLSDRAVNDKITRILVIFGACAGVCYNALWYFPVIMAIGGFAALLWYGHFSPLLTRFKARRRHESSPDGFVEDTAEGNIVPLEENPSASDLVHRRINASSPKQPVETPSTAGNESSTHALREAPTKKPHTIRIGVGVPIFLGFFSKCLSLP